MSGSGHAVEFRQDIQGLRAVAVLLVVADHSGVRWLTGGFVGVDVFFVISGYLITLLLLRQAASTGRVRIGEFYARRARRILPAASLVIVATMMYAAREVSLSRVRQLRVDGLWSAFFAANIHFSRLETDYFAQGPEPSPFQHYWSLAVEEQFYLVWPLIVMIAGRRGVSRIAVALVACSIALRLVLVLRHVRAESIFVSTPTHLDGIVVGAWAAANRLRAWRRIVWLGVAAAATYAAIALFRGTANPYDPVVQVSSYTLVALASVGLLAYGARGNAKWLAWRPLTLLGRVSYGLYVIHFPIVGVLMQRWPHGGWPAIGVAVSASLALTALSWVCLERPILSLKRYVPYGTRQALRVHA